MRIRYHGVVLVVAAAVLCAGTSASAQDKFRLKPGAKGKICLSCHVTFQDLLKDPAVHTPVRTGDCSGCHNPHTSSHGKLLAATPETICNQCHGVIPKDAASTHKVVAEGKCVSCHDPHAAKNKFNLLKAGNDLCLSCHDAVGAAIAKARFKHRPVEQGCLSCHDPHASTKAKGLLKKAVPALCADCHKTDAPSFVKRHMGYPVAGSDCTGCHNPHGSSRGNILYDTVHKPVANRMCNQCHDEPTSAQPLRTKKEGYELCRGCHSTMLNEAFSRKHLHWPVVTKRGCSACHAPHASAGPSLLRGSMTKVCGECHQDTIDRQERALEKHVPVTEGNCTVCHQPHSSDNDFLLAKPLIGQCSVCHDWQKHSSHPMGEKIRDPRNKNLEVQCLSCHSSHGTQFKKMLLAETVTQVCTQCHAEYRR